MQALSQRRLDPPYIAQLPSARQRTCGAACLAMAYAALGHCESVEAIWRRVAEPDRSGRQFARTQRLAIDALQQDLAVAVLRPLRPYAALQALTHQGCAVIVNHRLLPDQPWGHFSLFRELDATSVTTHDPTYGADRKLAGAEFDSLWRPQRPDEEITGYVLLAIARRDFACAQDHPCTVCGYVHDTLIEQQLGGETGGISFCPACDHARWIGEAGFAYMNNAASATRPGPNPSAKQGSAAPSC